MKFRQKPLTLTLLLDVQEHFVVLKELIPKQQVYAHRRCQDGKPPRLLGSKDETSFV